MSACTRTQWSRVERAEAGRNWCVPPLTAAEVFWKNYSIFLCARAAHTWKSGPPRAPRFWQYFVVSWVCRRVLENWMLSELTQSTEAIGRIPHIFNVKDAAQFALGNRDIIPLAGTFEGWGAAAIFDAKCVIFRTPFTRSSSPFFGPRRHTVFDVCRRGALYISPSGVDIHPVEVRVINQQHQHSVAILAQVRG